MSRPGVDSLPYGRLSHTRTPARKHAPARILLTLDIGNSAEGELTRVFSVVPPDPAPADQETAYWRDALTPHLSDTTITQIGLVPVVSSRTEAVTDALRPLTDAPTTFVHPDLELPFALDYEPPDTLGADIAGSPTTNGDESGALIRRPASPPTSVSLRRDETQTPLASSRC